jgi:superfamily I DNA/RNA helicase
MIPCPWTARWSPCRHLQANLFPQVPYDFVMVDEGQDLDATSFDILRSIARHVTVCIDHKQQIYEGGSSETDILQRLKLKRRNLSLLEAFRCCPFIVSLASSLVDDQEEREAYIRQHRTAQAERETPLLFVAKNFEEEKEVLLISSGLDRPKAKRWGFYCHRNGKFSVSHRDSGKRGWKLRLRTIRILIASSLKLCLITAPRV